MTDHDVPVCNKPESSKTALPSTSFCTIFKQFPVIQACLLYWSSKKLSTVSQINPSPLCFEQQMKDSCATITTSRCEIVEKPN